MTFLIVVIIFVIIFVLLCLIPGYTGKIKDKHGKVLLGSIATLEKISIGKTKQWILIRGNNISNPVILFLHGGPGTANMTLNRKYLSELEKHFVVVSWDQRGAGKSFAANNPESDMNIDQFISDTTELTDKLCHRFCQKKIFLVGHSWGSVLGILTVQKHPEFYHAYIGIGQIANMAENERISYEWTMEQAIKADDKLTVDKLIKIGKPPYAGNWQKKFMTERRLLGKFGGEFYRSTKGAFPVVIGSLLRSTEYTLIDKINFFRGIFTTVRLIWQALLKTNLLKQAPSLDIPVYFVLGKHDFEAPSVLAEQYFNILNAPHKELIWFDNSAHLPNIEENKKFCSLMINHILPEICFHFETFLNNECYK